MITLYGEVYAPLMNWLHLQTWIITFILHFTYEFFFGLIPFHWNCENILTLILFSNLKIQPKQKTVSDSWSIFFLFFSAGFALFYAGFMVYFLKLKSNENTSEKSSIKFLCGKICNLLIRFFFLRRCFSIVMKVKIAFKHFNQVLVVKD